MAHGRSLGLPPLAGIATWPYYVEMARQVWDEARHAMMGEVGFDQARWEHDDLAVAFERAGEHPQQRYDEHQCWYADVPPPHPIHPGSIDTANVGPFS